MADFVESCVLSFDVGGSHVAAAVCCGKDFRLGPVVSAPHPAAQSCDAFLDLLFDLGTRAEARCDRNLGVMLAVPGPFDLLAGISLMRHKLPYLYGIDLRRALAARFRAIVGNYERRTGVKREVIDLAAAAPEDPAAEQAFAEFGGHLGEVIRSLLAGFHAEVIVLGGGISRSPSLFLPAVRNRLGDSSIQLRASELQSRAALVGCGVAALRPEGGSPDAVESKSVHSGAV